jgi:hypothetical protein
MDKKQLNLTAKEFVPSISSSIPSSTVSFEPSTNINNSNNTTSNKFNNNHNNNNYKSNDNKNINKKNIKKTSDANHLLNFQFATPLQSNHHQSNNHSNNHKSKFIKNNKEKSTFLSKSQFLQANFIFVISPFADVKEEGFYSPDSTFWESWDSVESVIVPTTSTLFEKELICPICLDYFQIPKITKCGHTFCISCIFRHLGCETQKKCPVCAFYTKRSDLKSVKFINMIQAKEDQKIDLNLLRLPKGSIFPQLGSEFKDNNSSNSKQPLSIFDIVPSIDISSNSSFSRIVVISINNLRQKLNKEVEELIEYRKLCLGGSNDIYSQGDVENIPSVTEAMDILNEKIKLFEKNIINNGKLNKNIFNNNYNNNNNLDKINEETNNSLKKTLNSSSQSSVNKDTDIELVDDNDNVSLLNEIETNLKKNNFYNLYQANDGALIFLHPICLRCLLLSVGDDPFKLPLNITAKILEVENMKINPLLRQKIPFLRFLPKHCDIILLEIDMKQLVEKKILSLFSAELTKRSQKRKDKAIKLKKENKRDDYKNKREKSYIDNIRLNLLLDRTREEEKLVEWIKGPEINVNTDDNISDNNNNNEPIIEEKKKKFQHGIWGKKSDKSFSEIIKIDEANNFPTLTGMSSHINACIKKKSNPTPVVVNSNSSWTSFKPHPNSSKIIKDQANMNEILKNENNNNKGSSKKKEKNKILFTMGSKSYN